MIKQLIRKVDKRFGQVSYENIIYFINNQGNKNEDYSRKKKTTVEFHIIPIKLPKIPKNNCFEDYFSSVKMNIVLQTLPPALPLSGIDTEWPPSLGTQANT